MKLVIDSPVIVVEHEIAPIFMSIQTLLRAGILREQMVLRYAGKTLPEHLQPKPEHD